MNAAHDIINRIESDYGTDAKLAHSIINDTILKAVQLDHSRIIRCVIFLAQKDIQQLKLYLEKAAIDPRDVMFWAEYINTESNGLIRVRDFNNVFGNEEKNVKE